MNKEQTLKAIEVMQAYVEGKKVQLGLGGRWHDCGPVDLCWDWGRVEYRVKPVSKPAINWDHVHPDYKWMATDADGDAFLYKKEPTAGRLWWAVGQHRIGAHTFKSFIPGDCDWKESLVQRPESV